jgi:hypothetical protein
MAELSDRLIADGRRFIQALDAAGVPSSAALWLWSDRQRQWRYLLASPLVEPNQDMPARIAAVLALMPAGFAIDRDNLRLYAPDAEPVRTLQALMQTGPGIAAIRMTDNTINGVHVGDAYVYRLYRKAA